ncbi:MAG TPA: LysM peptidoglycan-binding domain-containing protein [Dokdonella sp.]|nr:LysM peptidoglycan-binding domain-containing protein [Dokdonella sp.]
MANEPKKPDFSNVQGGGQSTAPPPAPKADFSNVQSGVQSTAPAATQTYTVAKGDSLSKIAKHFYGHANDWKRIFEANRDQLDDPDLIKPGQVLKIPAAND